MQVREITVVSVPLAVALFVSACATKPEEIPASYISPLTYEKLTCSQIAGEAERISSRAADISGVQRKRAKSDAVAVGVGVVLFWPALFFVKGSGATEGEIARLKGEMNAIKQASIKKNCDLKFNTNGA